MGLFDTVSKKDSVTIGNTLLGKQTSEPKGNYKHIETEASKIKAERLARQKNSSVIYEENRKLQNSMPVMPGYKNIGVESVSKMPERPTVTKEALIHHVNETQKVFMENLSHALFVGKIAVINVEACNISERSKSNDKIKQIIYEQCLSIFNSICKEKDFNKIAQENNIPSFVTELWDLSCEAANVDAKQRINYDVVREACGLDEEKINNYLQAEVNNLTIQNESLSEYFESTAAQIIYENDDIVESIKSKISKEIDDYKESAKKIANIKKAVEGDIKEADKIPGTNGQSDEKPENDDSSKSDSDEGNSSDNINDNSEGDKNPPEESNSDDTASTDDDDDKTPENGDTSTSDSDDGDAKTSDGEGETSTENEGDDPLENQQKLQELSPEITQELEDATSFALNYSHTFNTGDEKFEKMRKRLSAELVTAMDNNDLNKMNEIKSTVVAMKNKLHEINATSENKYKDMESRLDDMINSTSFEINSRIEKTTVETESSRSMLESFIIKIAKRKISQTTNEGFEFDEITAPAIMSEAVIYRTTMETFNTLKMYPKTPSGIESVRETIAGIKH